jgi:hypothetical protein
VEGCLVGLFIIVRENGGNGKGLNVIEIPINS